MTNGDAVPLACYLPLGLDELSTRDVFSEDRAMPQSAHIAPKSEPASKGSLLRRSPYEGKSVFYTGNNDGASAIDGVMVLSRIH